MTVDLDAALADASELQAHKQKHGARAPRIGLGPDRQMPYVAALRAGDLFVDRSYQRPLEGTRVTRMVQDWDPTMLGVLEVSDRGPDTTPRYAIIAGQHRHQAAVTADPRGGDVPLVCNVHRGLDVAGEASLMHELDRTQKKLTGHDQWKARRASRDPRVLAIEAIVHRHGLRIGPNRADGVLAAYGAAEHLYSVGGDLLLDNTLAVLTGAYGPAAGAWQSPLITGLGRFLNDEAGIDIDRLIRALAACRPEQLRAQASSLRDIESGGLSVLMTRVIANLYRRTPKAGGRS